MRTVRSDHHGGFVKLCAADLASVLAVLDSIALPVRNLTTATIRAEILSGIHLDGWSGRTKLDKASGITIASVRGSTALCLQTGNMSRFYADLLKLQLLYVRKKIGGAVFLLLTKMSATRVGDNVANYERLVNELALFSDIITVPAVIFGLDVFPS